MLPGRHTPAGRCGDVPSGSKSPSVFSLIQIAAKKDQMHSIARVIRHPTFSPKPGSPCEGAPGVGPGLLGKLHHDEASTARPNCVACGFDESCPDAATALGGSDRHEVDAAGAEGARRFAEHDHSDDCVHVASDDRSILIAAASQCVLECGKHRTRERSIAEHRVGECSCRGSIGCRQRMERHSHTGNLGTRELSRARETAARPSGRTARIRRVGALIRIASCAKRIRDRFTRRASRSRPCLAVW